MSEAIDSPVDENHARYQGYENWKGWTDLFSYSPDKADYFLGETRGVAVANAEVLELGFGSGDFLQWAIDQGARVVGTEINPQLSTAADARGIELLDASLRAVEDGCIARFDTIVAFDVFEHLCIDDIVVSLKAAELMLKSGGHVVMRFPNAQSPFGLVPQCGDPTHRSNLSRGVFEQLIQGSKFSIVRYGPSFRPRGRRPLKIVIRAIRYILRDIITLFLNFVYVTKIPYDAVVVIVLRKSKN